MTSRAAGYCRAATSESARALTRSANGLGRGGSRSARRRSAISTFRRAAPLDGSRTRARRRGSSARAGSSPRRRGRAGVVGVAGARAGVVGAREGLGERAVGLGHRLPPRADDPEAVPQLRLDVARHVALGEAGDERALGAPRIAGVQERHPAPPLGHAGLEAGDGVAAAGEEDDRE